MADIVIGAIATTLLSVMSYNANRGKFKPDAPLLSLKAARAFPALALALGVTTVFFAARQLHIQSAEAIAIWGIGLTYVFVAFVALTGQPSFVIPRAVKETLAQREEAE